MSKVSKKRILITGGAGFIGSHLARRLHALQQLSQVDVIDIKPKPDWFDAREICDKYLSVDLRNRDQTINALMQRGPYDHIFHFAADMGGIGFIQDQGHDAEILHNNLSITLSVLHWMRYQAAHWEFAPKMLFSSSACVYPTEVQSHHDVVSLPEDIVYPADPDSDYGWEKLTGERLCQAFARDFGYTIKIARFHNIFGPFGTYEGGREKAPAALCRKIAKAGVNGKSEIEVWGDGEQRRSFLYIEDCLDAVLRLMGSRTFHGPVNIGSEECVTINEMCDIIQDIAGKPNLVRAYDTTKPQGVQSRNSHNALIRDKLGWEPAWSLREGLEETFEWINAMVKGA